MRTLKHSGRLQLGALIVILLACLWGAASCTPQAPPDTHLVFMAGYKAQANLPFVGVYVAEAQGYFADEGLTVEIQHSAGGGEHLQLLVAGKVDITTQDAGVMLQRRAQPGLPLVSIALIGQQGQQAFVALADAGIETLDDWRGRKIGYKGTPPPELFALLDVAGLTEADVELINVGFDPRVLIEGLVDIYPVYLSNEPYALRSWGYELTTWAPADYGVAMMGLAYVASEETVAAKPAALAGFTRAVLQGIAYAEAHPDEAVEVVLSYTGPEADPDLMRYMLETEIAMTHSPLSDQHGVGWQTQAQWQALLDLLIRYDVITAELDPAAAFTTDFLP
jgi:ABC-type nitrate/sulfonate/bicarbonate transport system substrate-binding protein